MKVTFALPYGSQMKGLKNIYVLDMLVKKWSQSLFYRGDVFTTILPIKSDKDYIPGESYTLYIDNILGGKSEVLGRFI